MKREILFKAKRKDNNQWAEGLLSYTVHRELIIVSFTDENQPPRVFNINPEAICQFTGITDKNGAKIFEGDKFILRGCEVVVVYREKFCDYTFQTVEWKDRVLNLTKANITKYNLEIIGNIHD